MIETTLTKPVQQYKSYRTKKHEKTNVFEYKVKTIRQKLFHKFKHFVQ